MTATDHARLRPVERCVLRMTDAGLPDPEIGRRLKRSAEYPAKVRYLTAVPRPHAPSRRADDPLRPVERCVLRWLDSGQEPAEVAARFRRSETYVELVVQLARYKLEFFA